MTPIESQKLASFIDKKFERRKLHNSFMLSLLGLGSILVTVPLFLILGFITVRGVVGINWEFFFSLPAPVGEAGGGMGNAILGSLIVVSMASMIGIPWGLGLGVFLWVYRYARLTKLVRTACYLLASIPSIIIGLFVYTLVVAPMKHFSSFSGSVALALIMIPIIAKTTEEILMMLPNLLTEGGLALGLPRWKVIVFIVLRSCKTGIMTGLMLAIARIAGETAPLLFTAFNNRFWGFNPNEPIATLPIQIYTYAISPFEEWHQQAWTGAFILVSMVFLMSLLTRFVIRTTGQNR